MPLYEYECRGCGHNFEKIVRSASASDEVRCPECDSEDVERAISLCGAVSVSGGRSMVDSSCAPTGG